jgi:hypothetical protein
VAIICHSVDLEVRFRTVFQETLLGPLDLNEDEDYDPSISQDKR